MSTDVKETPYRMVGNVCVFSLVDHTRISTECFSFGNHNEECVRCVLSLW